MHKRQLSYLLYSAVVLLISIYGFFYTTEVAAQTPSNLPDLTITKASLNGAALNFLYHNLGDGAAKPEVSFWYEWVDGQGRRLGELYWLNVDGLAGKSKREAYQLLDSSTLEWERGKVKFADLVHSSPRGAMYLKLAIDGPNAHKESNEQNNTVLLPVLRTDFTMTDAEFRNDFPWFKYHNRGNLGHQEGKKVSFWFEWVDVRGARVGDLHWLDVEPPSILSPRSASLARSTSLDSMTTVFSTKGATKLTAFLNSAPNGATHLKIAIDGPNAFAEFNEGNNAVFLEKLITQPPPETSVNLLPKLALTLSSEIISRNGKTREAHPGDDVRATLVVKNIGEISATGLSLSLYCPKNTTLKNAELNGKDKKREARRFMAASNLDKDAAHRLVVVCTIGNKATRNGKGTLTFAATARLKEGNSTFKSNNIKVTVVQQPKEAKLPEVAPKPSPPPQAPPKKPEEPKPEPQNAFPRQDLSTDSDFGF